jgi:hypothetical protein
MTVRTAAMLAGFVLAGASCTSTPRMPPPADIPVVTVPLAADPAAAASVAARWLPLDVERAIPVLHQPAKVRLRGELTVDDSARVLGVSAVQLDHVVMRDGGDLLAQRPPSERPEFFWPVPVAQQTGAAPLSVEVLLPVADAAPGSFRRIAGRVYVLWADDYRTVDLPIGRPSRGPGKWQKFGPDLQLRLVHSEVGPSSVEIQTEYRARTAAQMHFQGWTPDLLTPFVGRVSLVGTVSPEYDFGPLGGGASGADHPFDQLVRGNAGKYTGFKNPVDYSTVRFFVVRKATIRELRFDLADVPVPPK